ncbi:extracellular solute-binding protein [Paenibacillus albicereus]|uniref:Extracellular solute-binding protein n=2 Tax=Paenibacillus albicereus TaxID=2726185 RepID=A0A6H2H4B1_9BACL|nr:extracellular solute-binding protein [Paenibacillus albicereus]
MVQPDGAVPTPLAAKVKPVSFSQFVLYDWYTPPTWAERPHAGWITRELGVEVRPVRAAGSPPTQLNAMVVGGSLPDALVLDRGKDVERLAAAGLLVPLDGYLAAYPEFERTIGRDTLDMLRSSDGRLYQIPNWFIRGEEGSGNAAYLVNRTLHRALGSPPLDTWEQLEAYLRRVKAAFPEVVPLEAGETRDGAEPQLLGMLYSGADEGRNPAFAAPGAGGVFGVPREGRLTSVYRDPAFRETVRFANRLYREGLARPDGLTQTRDQIVERLKRGGAAVFASYDAVVEGVGREVNHALAEARPGEGYDAVWPLRRSGVDPERVYPGGYNRLGWNVNVITRAASDPEAIFSFMNWAVSEEGQTIFFFGPPGLFYDRVEDGVPIPNEAYERRDPGAYDQLKLGEFNWYGNTSFINAAKAERESRLAGRGSDWTASAQARITFRTSLDMTEFSNLDPLPSSPEGIVMERLRQHYKETVPRLLLARSEREAERELEEAAEEADRLGYGAVLEWKTARWRDNLRILGRESVMNDAGQPRAKGAETDVQGDARR